MQPCPRLCKRPAVDVCDASRALRSQVRFHPSDVSALVTGSTDGYVNVFDVRQTTEEDALQATLNTESSVSSITWWVGCTRSDPHGRGVWVRFKTPRVVCRDCFKSYWNDP